MRGVFQHVLLILTLTLAASNLSAEPQAERGFKVTQSTDGSSLEVTFDGLTIMHHDREHPAISVGSGVTTFKETYGNFLITDNVVEKVDLVNVEVAQKGKNKHVLTFSTREGTYKTKVMFSYDDKKGLDHVIALSLPKGANRTWVRLYAEEEEHVYGGGEQFSHFDLRGHSFPMWVREQGVGRQSWDLITHVVDQVHGGGGGDYHTTYWPQPTVVSSRRYFCHFTTTNYMVMDFDHPDHHEIQIWGDPGRIVLDSGHDFFDVSKKLSGVLGRQPPLPEWVYSGTILGVQGGTDTVLEHLRQAEKNGVKVSALWVQDWVGKLHTYMGKRLYWDWAWDKSWYPGLDNVIKEYKSKGVRFLSYINPHLIVEGPMFKEANLKGYLVANSSGQSYLQDFGGFFCGTVDLTNPDAYQWFKDVMKRNMVDLGFAGWMADFGEYLATDMVYHSGESPETVHNLYPVLWARLNREVVEEAGKLDEITIWMRAGYSGSENYTLLAWAGDQTVDARIHDGLASVIPAALSLAVSGFGLHHYDIGGYITLPTIYRTEEVLLRYAEAAVFTPVMRTHEGNRPDDSWQVFSSADTLRQFGRLTRMYVHLAGYIKQQVRENSMLGVPVQRPLFYHYPDDRRAYSEQYQYMFGPDVLVAPVYHEEVDTWDAYLPGETEEWVHLWTGASYTGGQVVSVSAPVGEPPVFYRVASTWADVFRKILTDFPRLRDVPPATTRWGLLWHLRVATVLTAGVVGAFLACSCVLYRNRKRKTS
ncbi:sulfoquinovosidase-like [Branchiostoma floridae]|uniref:Sulfoquinovosidase-like n=1 Tax=Branchiostoma floridae TaxID=7739 RepID=A0A9J7M4J6_BRAFL|nr:sulfoquinovosidase-like [Branchiostoma floridae]